MINDVWKLLSSTVVRFAWQTGAASRILDGLSVGGAVFAGHLHRFCLGFQGFTAFTTAVFSPGHPFGGVSEAAGAGTTSQSVDLVFIDALHGLSAQRLLHLQDADGFVGRNGARLRVTFGFFAMSAARSAGIFALLLARRIIPFALFAHHEAIFARHGFALFLGAQTLVLDAMTFAAFRVEGIRPTGVDRMRDAVDDALLDPLDGHAVVNLAAAIGFGFHQPLAYAAFRRLCVGTRRRLALQVQASALIRLVHGPFARSARGHDGFLAKNVDAFRMRTSAKVVLRVYRLANWIAKDGRFGRAGFRLAATKRATAIVLLLDRSLANGASRRNGSRAWSLVTFLMLATARVRNRVDFVAFGAIGRRMRHARLGSTFLEGTAAIGDVVDELLARTASRNRFRFTGFRFAKGVEQASARTPFFLQLVAIVAGWRYDLRGTRNIDANRRCAIAKILVDMELLARAASGRWILGTLLLFTFLSRALAIIGKIFKLLTRRTLRGWRIWAWIFFAL